MSRTQILVINPGSTSTKIALYEMHEQIWQENIEHDPDKLHQYPTIYAQLPYRLEIVKDAFHRHGGREDDLACIMARGGLLPPLPSGAYEVNEEMLDVLENRPMNHHASNLGAAIALRLAEPLGIKAYIYDPVTVDEMIDVVRITGIKEIKRHGQGHNLNMRAAALKYCRDNNLDYKSQNLIVAHLGGGITLTLHEKGRIVDMISDDEGPFCSTRAGLIPGYKLAKLISEKNLSYRDTMKKLQRESGLVSLLGVEDCREVEKMIENGDEYARLVYEAMALSVSESIARLAAVVNGSVDRIILTGGIAYSQMFTGMVEKRVSFISPVTVIPGENEMQALADGACRILTGEETAKEYVEPKERPY